MAPNEYVAWFLFLITGHTVVESWCPVDFCEWFPWQHWSSCSRSCGGGWRQRSRLICCETSWNEYIVNGTCTNTCGKDYTGYDDNAECALTCVRGSYVGSNIGCLCDPGYYGICCEKDIDECSQYPQPCRNGGTCTNRLGSYSCRCADGFTGTNCEADINECASNPCQHGGTCHDHVNGYTCTCPSGYTGVICQSEINECRSSPCQNYGVCTDNVDGYTCTCADGFTGVNCEIDIDECQSDPCQNNGTCIDNVNYYTCDCPDEYYGVDCEFKIEQCGENNCTNNSTCSATSNDTYICFCQPGFTGDYCEIELDECDPEPCMNNGTCTGYIGRYTCDCLAGFTGENCSIDIDECLSTPCINGGTCEDRINAYKCNCVGGFTDINCQTAIDECGSLPCQNDGTCYDQPNSYDCVCHDGYTGINCEIDIDECQSSPCLNGATCNDLVNHYNCSCTDMFYGTNCETGICQILPADFIFLLDSSISQTKDQFEKQLEFVKDFVKHFTISENETRISVITFSTNSVVEFYLNAYNYSADIEQAISDIKFRPGATFTNKGLDSIYDVIDETNGGNSIRPTGRIAKRYVVLLTDGMSNDRQATKQAATDVKRVVDKVIVIGIGRQVSHKELIDVASPADDYTPNYVFTAENFNSLFALIKQLVHIRCAECQNSSLSDIVFLVDESHYMTTKDFQAALNDMTHIISGIADYGEIKGPRIGVAVFNSEVDTVLNLNHGLTMKNLQAEIQRIPMQGFCRDSNCGMNVTDAVIAASNESFSDSKGSRKDSRRFLILLSNGQFETNENNSTVIEKLEENNVRLVIIGVGENVNTDALFSLVTNSSDVYVRYTNTDLTVLNTLHSEFRYNVCDDNI